MPGSLSTMTASVCRSRVSSLMCMRSDQCLGFVVHRAGNFGRLKDHVGMGRPRSEEHTSELQSLMRISYAVFCLKKKKTASRLITNILFKEQQNRTFKLNDLSRQLIKKRLNSHTLIIVHADTHDRCVQRKDVCNITDNVL